MQNRFRQCKRLGPSPGAVPAYFSYFSYAKCEVGICEDVSPKGHASLVRPQWGVGVNSPTLSIYELNMVRPYPKPPRELGKTLKSNPVGYGNHRRV